MARPRNCPKCDKDITDSYEGIDEDVGIMSAGWYCDDCEEFVQDEFDYDD